MIAWFTNFSRKVETAVAQSYSAEVRNINRKLDKIMATQAEDAANLQKVAAQLDKVGTETTALLKSVEDLKAAAAANDVVSPELQTAIDTVAAKAQAIDDLVPDAAPPTP